MRLILLFIFCGISFSVFSQRVLLIEKRNSAKTEKLYEGDFIQYKLIDDESWQRGKIYDLRDDTQMIVFRDRYIPLNEIQMMRQHKPWAKNLGLMLIAFGTSWSGFAALGTATDGNPDTNYRWSDAAVTGISVGTGLLLPALFGTRKMRFGEGRKLTLRVLDINF